MVSQSLKFRLLAAVRGRILLVSARPGFSHVFCLLKPFGYSRFWKAGEKLPRDASYFCFAMAQDVSNRLYPECVLWSRLLSPPQVAASFNK